MTAPPTTSFGISTSNSTRQSNSSSSTNSGAQHPRVTIRTTSSLNNNNIYNNNKNNNTMLAAENFQRSYNHIIEPRVRRRSFDQAGHFGNNQNGPLDTPPSTSPIPSPPLMDSTTTIALEAAPTSPVNHPTSANPFMCASIPAFSALTLTPGTNAQLFTQRVSQSSKACRQRYGPVASKAAGKAKAGMAELAVIASEVYRQECRSSDNSDHHHNHHHGEDDEFFVNVVPNGDGANNSSFLVTMEDNSLLLEQRDTTNEMPVPTSSKKKSHRNKKLLSSSSSSSSLSSTSPETKQRMLVVTPSTVGSTSSERLTPPPRVDRTSIDPRHDMPFQNGTVHSGRRSKENHPAEEDDGQSLRGTGIDLFLNQVAGIDHPEARLAKALDDLNRQDVLIQSLRRQMQLTQNTLDDTTQEMIQVKAAAKEKQFKATEIRARAVQEKKRLEDLYQKEIQENKQLKESISQLQVEVSTLKTSLRNSRTNKNPVVVVENGQSSQIISLKAELVELRSQLAEARAIHIDDSSSRNNMSEMEELKKKLKKDECEINELRQQNQEGIRERQHLMEQENLLQEKLDSLQSSSQETHSRLEENLMIAMKSADDVRAELVKTKANLQRMERERTRAKLHSSADMDRVHKELTKSREECGSLKEELAKVRTTSKAECEELTKKLEQLLRDQHEKANHENLAQTTDSMREVRKLQDEASCHVIEIRELKEQLMGKDNELASKSKTIAKLEEDIQLLNQGFQGETSAVSRKSRDVEFSESKYTSVFTEATLYKALLNEAKLNPTAHQTQVFLMGLDTETISQLKGHLEKFQASTPNCDSISLEASLKQEISALKSRLAVSRMKPDVESPIEKKKGRLVATEQAFLNEISVLKAKLAESHTKIREEAFRLHEERRVNREGEIERLADMEILQAERNQAVQARNALQSEVAALRKRLSSLGSADVPDLIPETSSCSNSSSKEEDIIGVPSNVRRLRSELAQARERLAAARENTRSIPIRPTTSPGPHYEPTNWSRRTSHVSEHTDKERSTNPSTTDGQPLVPPSHADGSSFVPESTTTMRIDFVASKAETPLVSNGRTKNISLKELTRQLDASRKRLETADQRLNVLVSDGSLLTIVRESPMESSFDGSIDEVVNTADGNIEVNHRRFADV
jgi:hypothetical protein